jgi:hypothetical protein
MHGLRLLRDNLGSLLARPKGRYPNLYDMAPKYADVLPVAEVVAFMNSTSRRIDGGP